MSESKKNSAESILLIQTGGNGTVFQFSTGIVIDKRYQAIVIHADAVFTTLEDSDGVDLKTDLGIAGNTIAQGTLISAKAGKSIKNITLASGSIIGIE